jgi:tol-pal system protein YbgF
MKARLVILLFACSSVYSESWALPEVIDNSVYPPSAVPANPPSSPSTTTLIEMMARMEQLQAEVQQLTGKVEEQAYLISELKKHQSTMYSDFDERLQNIETKGDDSSQPATEPPPEATIPGDGKGEAEQSGGDTAPATPAPASTPPTPSEPAPSAPAPAPKPETTPISDIEKQEYQQAYNALRKGHTSESITAFNAYLSKYPTGGYANNAQYWLGEAYRVNKDNASARKAFNDVIEKYPDSAKVPDALLKLGYIEFDEKNSAKAREYLTRVNSEFPNTPAARLAAKKLLLLDYIQN